MFHSLLIILTPPHETPPYTRRGMDLLYEVYIDENLNTVINIITQKCNELNNEILQ